LKNDVPSKAMSGQEVSGYSRYSGYLFDWQPIEKMFGEQLTSAHNANWTNAHKMVI